MKHFQLRFEDEALHARVQGAAKDARRSMNSQIMWMLEQQLEQAQTKRDRCPEAHDGLSHSGSFYVGRDCQFCGESLQSIQAAESADVDPWAPGGEAAPQ